MQHVLTYARARLESVIRVDESPVAQHLYQQAQERVTHGLSRREKGAEAIVGGGFVAMATLLFVLGSSGRPIQLGLAGLLIGAFAVISRVEFDVGRFYTVPSQVVLTPMLLLLPPESVPACVVIALTLAKLPDTLARRRSLPRLLLSLSDSWFSLGPAAVLVLAGSPSAAHVTLPVLLGCAAAQFACDFAASASRELIAAGDVNGLLEENAWIYLVDLLLWPIGFLGALAAEAHHWAILLLLSFAGLLRLFSFERRARLDQLTELSTAYRGTAVLLGDVVEADHEYTGEHSKGVVDLAVAVANEMGLDAAARQRVEFGALLHDVGKIAIPKEIIDKPGKLDEREWEIMKTHTIEGERMLTRVGGLLSEVGRVVRSSHEHFDGSGYPDGLAGAEIPLESRIVSCCDAYSAMTTDRSYRAARSPAEAVQELKDCAFTQFDPAVVLALIGVIERQAPMGGGEDAQEGPPAAGNDPLVISPPQALEAAHRVG